MARLGQAAVKELFKELAYKFEIPFEEKCFEILQPLFDTLEKVPPRGDFDSSGIDLFAWDSRTEKISICFQCKGFQKKTFEDDQLKYCIKSIQSFLASDKTVGKYYLIINRSISKEYSQLLELELNKLVIAKKAKHAYILDINRFLEFLYDKQVEAIKKEIEQSYNFFHNEYISSMEQLFYYENVPFKYSSQNLRNPLSHIIERSSKGLNIKRSYPAEHIAGKYFFIISEFGFGKTSLMFKLYEKLKENSFTPLYLPVAAFTSEGLSKPLNFCSEILNLINSFKIESWKVYNNFKARVLKNIFDTSPNLILLIDGLDEHKFLRKDINLKALFNWIQDFKAIPIFSLRKEFWDERQGNINMAVGKSRKIQDKIFLSTWEEKDILNYINLYIVKRSLISLTQKAHIENLRAIIAERKYENYYGDIPKRPLFLEMIISDVINENIRNRSLSKLYEQYIIEKIYRDKTGNFTSFIMDRGLSLDVDMYKFKDLIFQILQYCASKMYLLENHNVILVNEILSSEIESFIRENYSMDLLNLLLHSVLVSAEERRGMNIKLKFSHFSFLEFFFAQYVTADCLINGIWFSYKYDESVFRFIKEILIDQEKDSLIKDFKFN